MMIPLYIGLIFILIGLNAFFISVEYAIAASHRSQLDTVASPNPRSFQTVADWLENQQSRRQLLASIQVSITLISLALGILGAKTVEAVFTPLIHQTNLPAWLHALDVLIPILPLLLSLPVIAGLQIVLGNQVPKAAVLHEPEKFALQAAPLMSFIIGLSKWFTQLLGWLTRKILRAIGIPENNNPHFSAEALKKIVNSPEVAGILEKPEQAMLSNVINIGDMRVRQIMIPRTEIVALEETTTLEEAIHAMLDHSITKIPIIDNDIDHISGILHLRDLVRYQRDGKSPHEPVGSIKREALFVPESIAVNDLLYEFRTHHSHIAIVLDEFGGTAGLVTLEDAMEEIVGDVQDAFEDENPAFTPIAAGKTIIDGFTLIEEVNHHFGLKLSNPYYDTISGYILDSLGRMANVGDRVIVPDQQIELEVISMDQLRIDQVCLSPIADTPPSDPSAASPAEPE